MQLFIYLFYEIIINVVGEANSLVDNAVGNTKKRDCTLYFWTIIEAT